MTGCPPPLDPSPLQRVSGLCRLALCCSQPVVCEKRRGECNAAHPALAAYWPLQYGSVVCFRTPQGK